MSIHYDRIHSDDKNPTDFSRNDIADFLFEHLDEFGDAREAILRSIAYAYGDGPDHCRDGFVLVAHKNEEILGVVIINDTNMSGYIPEHILVYIAVHAKARGQGVGSKLMEYTIAETKGDIALHVEPDNPARHLYEKAGFTNKYLEMRLKK
ncbi:MAG: GNAT family N-acetyltransferase [Balneolaceae bacterium]